MGGRVGREEGGNERGREGGWEGGSLGGEKGGLEGRRVPKGEREGGGCLGYECICVHWL